MGGDQLPGLGEGEDVEGPEEAEEGVGRDEGLKEEEKEAAKDN